MATVAEAPIEAMPNEPEANKLFRMVMKFKGSDLHLKVGLPPAMRLAGVLRMMQLPVLTATDMDRLMFPLLSPRQKNILEETGGVDFASTLANAIGGAGDQERAATEIADKFAAGDPNIGIHEVMIESEKASISLRFATTVKNQALAAYRELMNTPV